MKMKFKFTVEIEVEAEAPLQRHAWDILNHALEVCCADDTWEPDPNDGDVTFVGYGVR